MIGGTLDCGTQGCAPISYRVSYDTTWGWTVWPESSGDTSTTQGVSSLVSDTVRVSSTGPGRSRARRDADVEYPEFERPVRPVASRTRVRDPEPIVLAPKAAERPTQVAWTRGRAPRDLSFRTLRRLGMGLRR
jgi:hypothetical protein